MKQTKPITEINNEDIVYDNIPIPKREIRKGKKAIFPIQTIEVGQSFFYRKTSDAIDKRMVAGYLNYINYRCKYTKGKQFVWDIYQGGIMIWRTK